MSKTTTKTMSKKLVEKKPPVEVVKPAPAAAPTAPETVAISLPVKMLRVADCAARETGRYNMACVLVERRSGFTSAVATDGRALLIARTPAPKDAPDATVQVPRHVASRAVGVYRPGSRKIAPDVQLCPAADGKWTLEVPDLFGTVAFTFHPDEAKFPPYREIIPDFAASKGRPQLRVGPALLEMVVRTIRAVLPDAAGLSTFVPEQHDKMIGFQASSGNVEVMAVLMPVNGEPVKQILAGKAQPEPKAA